MRNWFISKRNLIVVSPQDQPGEGLVPQEVAVAFTSMDSRLSPVRASGCQPIATSARTPPDAADWLRQEDCTAPASSPEDASHGSPWAPLGPSRDA